MAAITPETVMKYPMLFDNMYGTTPRRIVEIFVSCTATASGTIDLSTYASELSAISEITGLADIWKTSAQVSIAGSISGTTVTFSSPAAGARSFVARGYY